jgi:hypothetical protein
VIINFRTKLFLNLLVRRKRFFKSSIGPSTKKPMTELIGIVFAKILAINASDVEQIDRIKAASIMTSTEMMTLPPSPVIVLCGIYV